MKNVILLIVISISCAFTKIQAQKTFTKDSLSISTLINIDEKVDFKNYEVKFKELLSDSRCPKDVMCNRAGEAKVLLSIYQDGELIKDKEVIIDASGYVIEDYNLAFSTDDLKIYGMNLKPYPTAKNSVLKEDYELEIVFQPKKLE